MFGPEVDNKQFFAPELITEENEVINTANHPTQILKLVIPFEVHKNDMIRVIYHED